MLAFEETIVEDNFKIDVWSPLVGRTYYQIFIPFEWHTKMNSLKAITEMQSLVGQFPILAVLNKNKCKGFSSREEAISELRENKLYQID